MAGIPHPSTGRRRAFAGARAVAAAAADADFVNVLGGRLRCGDRPAAFVCAAGVRLPAPGPAAGTNALAEACAAARGIARDLALAGFGMVRLTDLAVPRPGDPSTEARLAVQDEFVAACKDEGLRVWAEALHPVLDFVPSPADADALDDPATREAWREAVADTNFPAASILLAAPWDPRLEVLVQRRLRDWARAFNPRTGLRRCDDPVYALFSFSSLWWDDLDAASPPDLPPFLARELRDAWNDWLYERYRTDEEADRRIGLEPGESLAANGVAFANLGYDPLTARARERRNFLRRLSLEHFHRLLVPFSAFGQASRTAPRLVRHGGPERTLGELTTIGILEDVGRLPVPKPGGPFVVDASVRPPDRPLETALLAASSDADVLVLPAGDDPFRWSPAAAAFLAARDDPASLRDPARRDDGAFDFATAAHARLVVPAPGAEPSVATFPAAGAAVAVARVPAGEPPAFPPELAASDLPRQFLVCLPPEEEAPRAALDATVLLPASRTGACVLVVRARDGAGIGAFSVLARGRDLAKRECLPGGRPPAVPAEEGVFRADGLASPAVLLFRPSAPGPGLLRGL